jgi:hypothetical protein
VEQVCSQATYTDATLEVFCPFGTANELSYLGLNNMENTQCGQGTNIQKSIKNTDENCDLTKNDAVLQKFKETCKGK